MDKTLWKSTEKQFTPRNKQAAMIIRPNKNAWHMPPEEPKQPVFAKTQAEVFADEQAARKARIAELEIENAARKERRRQRKADKKKNQEKKDGRNLWAAHALKKQRKLAGLPPPVSKELKAVKKNPLLLGI